MDKMTKWLVGAAIGLFVIMSSLYTVRENETAIVLNLGKVVRTGMKPGLHFKMPLVETVKKYDRLDIAFNNAGTFMTPAEIQNLDIKNFDDVVRTNTYGVFYSMKYEIPIMRRQGVMFR